VEVSATRYNGECSAHDVAAGHVEGDAGQPGGADGRILAKANIASQCLQVIAASTHFHPTAAGMRGYPLNASWESVRVSVDDGRVDS
jgi:hypothetical protein